MADNITFVNEIENEELRKLDFLSRNIPELPQNKDYHLFIIYSSDHRLEVRYLVDRLETQGVKCCYYERDFIPGERIIEHMTNGIEKSTAVLIILSEAYNDSGYCKLETDMAIQQKMHHGLFIIPIKIERCIVPKVLAFITYIDAEDGSLENIHLVVIESLIKRELTVNEEKRKNGEFISIRLTAQPKRFCSMKRYYVNITDETRHSVAHKLHLEIPSDVHNNAERTINNSIYVRYIHILKNFVNITCRHLMLLYLFLIVIMFVLLSTLHITTNKQSVVVILVLSVGSLGLFFICCISVWCLCNCTRLPNNVRLTAIIRTLAFQNINKMLWKEINAKHYKKIKAVFIYSEDVSLEYAIRRVIENHETFSSLKSRQEQVENYVDRLFETYLSEYSCRLKENYTGKKRRHKTSSTARCLCLQIEHLLQT